ncbi:spore germination protein GerPC [Thalassobacillus pellis]|uniref:spore germination protein GerPC n=1 Tax=Thalassobacillus pellis TaxID=748008 RepID=UPI00195F8238|nr:spore germination protein GerPC [Thalassobacillus pellis]MBM7554092.1 spore germination protein PC [Thalassobacillus pellis]
MNHYGSWQQYMEQLLLQLNEQQKEIKALYEKLDKLEQNHSEQPRTVIEKIEYNFDQLKIETLEGTLHIGLSPQELNDMDDHSLLKNHYQVQKPANQKILEELDQFLLKQGSGLIRDLGNEQSIETTREMEHNIIQDIRNQLPERITYHEKADPPPQPNVIIEQIKQEIQHSIAQFLIQQKGEDM